MVEERTPEEVREALNDDGTRIVDIRPPEQFERGHIPGAINVPMGELPRRVGEIDWGENVIVTCPIGQSSVQAAKLIESYEGVGEGTRVASMAGGYEAWEYELESGDGAAESEA